MAKSSADERWVHSISTTTENEVEEDEEALSLCDLPVSEENQSRKEEEGQSKKTEEDFDFGSWGGSVLTESAMCAADEVFFQGQILPLRNSISSDSGLAMFRMDSRNPSRCISRSESMDHFYSGGFTSVSSRSSSIRSHHSSNSGSSATTSTTTHKQRVRNQFHSHPSPTPQIRLSNSQYGNVSHRTRKSTIWSFFRVGLVRAPGIELQDLKVRSNNSNTNKSFGSRNSTSSTSSSKNNSTRDDKSCSNIDKKQKQRFFNKNGTWFGGGCKCSVSAVDTVPSRVIIIKSNSNSANEAKEQAMKTTKKPNGKQAISRNRTFEWLKELSLAGAPDVT